MSTELNDIKIFYIIKLYEKTVFRNLLQNDFYEKYKFKRNIL
jgi:hypothetical protein